MSAKSARSIATETPKSYRGRLVAVWLCEYCEHSVSSFANDTFMPNTSCHCQLANGFMVVMTKLIPEKK